jgi:hypothetical protein
MANLCRFTPNRLKPFPPLSSSGLSCLFILSDVGADATTKSKDLCVFFFVIVTPKPLQPAGPKGQNEKPCDGTAEAVP